VGDAGGGQGAGSGPDGGVAAPVVVGREAEPPPPGLAGDRRLAVVLGVDVEPGGGEDPAVVGGARLRAVLVDRAAAVDEHRAVPPLVVAEEDVAAGPAGSGEHQLGGDVGQGVGLAGPDVDELRRGAAGGAPAAGHGGGRLVAQGRFHAAQPGREVTGREGTVVAHAADDDRGSTQGRGSEFSRRRARRTSATDQAWKGQPVAAWGGSPSAVSETEPRPHSARWASRPARAPVVGSPTLAAASTQGPTSQGQTVPWW